MDNSSLNKNLKQFFQRGDTPSQENFYQLIDTATSVESTLHVLSHLFGQTVDCVIRTPVNLLDDLSALVEKYGLKENESLLLSTQNDATENGIYQLITVQGKMTLRQSVFHWSNGFLIKGKRSLQNGVTFWECKLGKDTNQTHWSELNLADLPSSFSAHILNSKLPEQIDLMQNGADSQLSVRQISAEEMAIGQISVDKLSVDQLTTTQVTAGTLSGKGCGITDLNASHLTYGEVPYQRLPFATLAQIRNGNDTKVMQGWHGQWLSQKSESLSCPVLLETPVQCVQTETSIDVDHLPVSIDGIHLVAGQLVLLTAQQQKHQNRIWLVTGSGQNMKLTEPPQYPMSSLAHGHAVQVQQGNTHAGKIYLLTARYDQSDAKAEFEWHPIDMMVLAGIGLQSSHNQIHADLATSQDVEKSRPAKLVDAAVLKARLSHTEQSLNTSLTQKIDVEKKRIDGILSASEADKDSFAEIVALINKVNTESDQAFAGYVLSNDQRSEAIEKALTVETNSRTTQDTQFSAQLNNEVKARQNDSASRYTKQESDRRFLKLSGGTLSGDLNVTGAITASGDVTAFSDQRLKTDIRIISNALDRVTQLQGVTFRRTDLNDNQRYTGLIAQQVQAVIPEAVHEQNGYLSIAYGNLVGLLIESIKVLNSRLDQLQIRLDHFKTPDSTTMAGNSSAEESV
jgi:hypothetical protein